MHDPFNDERWVMGMSAEMRDQGYSYVVRYTPGAPMRWVDKDGCRWLCVPTGPTSDVSVFETQGCVSGDLIHLH
eukprot:29252-Eustigmatos_ZCMA.PRE.1